MKRVKLTEDILRKIIRESLVGSSNDILSQIEHGIYTQYKNLYIEYGEEGELDVLVGENLEYVAEVKYDLVGSPSLDDWGEEGQGINEDGIEFNVYPIEIYDENCEKVATVKDDGTISRALKYCVDIDFTRYDFDDPYYLDEGKIRSIIRESLSGIYGDGINGSFATTGGIYGDQWEKEIEIFLDGLSKGRALIDNGIVAVEWGYDEKDPRFIYYREGDDRLTDDHFSQQHSRRLYWEEISDIRDLCKRIYGVKIEIPDDEYWDEVEGGYYGDEE